MNFRLCIYSSVVLVCASFLLRADPGPLVLWSDTEATSWNQEAYPLGNGKLAAMVFGGITNDEIQFNEDTIWTGQPHFYENANATPAHLASIRNKVFQGQDIYSEALPYFMSQPLRQAMYQPAGSLLMSFAHSGASNYRRSLDLETATAQVSYDFNGVRYVREVFAGKPEDRVLVIRLTASEPGSISFSYTLSPTQPDSTLSLLGTDLVLHAWVSLKPRPEYYATGLTNAIEYEARVRILPEGGSVTTSGGDTVNITGADAVTLLLSVASNYVKYDDLSADPALICSNVIGAASAKTYAELRAAQLEDYQRLFHRVTLDLGSTSKTNLATGERIKRVGEGDDPQIQALFFQMGRYLMISGSRPGSQPLNLQGKWNNAINPSWESKMTLNINEEMNYWSAEVCNLSECHLPLFDMIEDLSETGQRVAAAQYYSGGWVVHHNTDLWRGAAPINGRDGIWPTGGAWLCMHLWWHYQYTDDTNFLANTAYPLMKGAAQFFLDSLLPHPSYPGWMVTNPSFSPEHSQPALDVANVAGPTIDNQLIRDLFDHVIEASSILGEDEDFRTNVVAMREKLPPNQIGRLGQLQEWLEDVDGATDQHRHLSHLIALFPGDEITPIYTPELAAAARVSLDIRGDGGGSTGWDKAWKICCRDRLLDSETAYLFLTNMIKSRIATNMTFTDVNNRQVDGIFGSTMGIAEMLLQSQAGEVFLLPALPAAWTNGSVSGLCARGGFEVDMTWRSNRLATANILSKLGHSCRVRSKWPISVKEGSDYLDAPMILPGLWEFPTTAGSNYTIVPANLREAEMLAATTSGDGLTVVNDPMFSGGSARRFQANAAEDFVSYVIPDLPAGTYRIQVVANAAVNGGQFQLAVGPVGDVLTEVGTVQDTYSPTNFVTLYSTNMLTELDCGTLQVPVAATYDFRFTVTGKQAASGGYNLSLDYIKLTPATAPARPFLTAVAKSGDLILSWPATAAGYSLESATNLPTSIWHSLSSEPTVVGEFNVVTNVIGEGQMFFRLKSN